jgi:hypothetical protein
MDVTSKRWKAWMEPRYEEIERRSMDIPEPTAKEPPPQYILWITGGRTMLDGEMIGLADLDFLDGLNSFNIAVASIREAMELAPRLTGCVMFGVCELEDDGEYHEWYDDDGNSLEELYPEPTTINPWQVGGICPPNPHFGKGNGWW